MCVTLLLRLMPSWCREFRADSLTANSTFYWESLSLVNIFLLYYIYPQSSPKVLCVLCLLLSYLCGYIPRGLTFRGLGWYIFPLPISGTYYRKVICTEHICLGWIPPEQTLKQRFECKYFEMGKE